LTSKGFDIPAKGSVSTDTLHKRQFLVNLVKSFFAKFSHSFKLDPLSVSNIDMLNQEAFLANKMTEKDPDSGFLSIINSLRELNPSQKEPSVSVEVLRHESVQAFEANKDPVSLVIHLNEFCRESGTRQFWRKRKARPLEVSVGILQSKEFCKQSAQYKKDMLGKGSPGVTELKTFAQNHHHRLALYMLLPGEEVDIARLVLKFEPEGASEGPWMHLLQIADHTGNWFTTTDIPQDFEPMCQNDWGEFQLLNLGFKIVIRTKKNH
jgi:hypothetical protein